MTNTVGADSASPQLLVLAPTGRDGPAVALLLRRAGLAASICADLEELIAGLEARADAVFVAEEALLNHPIDSLVAWVERQPPWSDLPFVVLTSRREHPAVVAGRSRLVAVLRNVSLLERPVQAITLTSAMRTAVRARQRQYEVRAHLAVQEQAARRLEELVVERTQALEAANSALHGQIAERERVEETLRQAQKIEAIGQLTGGVAHDFNNLLMVITGGLDMLGRQQDMARRQRLMDGMRQAASRGAALTKQLLAFSRRQALRAEPVDLSRQIGGMRELLDRSLRGDVTVALDFAADLWPVEVDPGELELVILNLAVNARDAMPEGGTVLIRAENAAALAEDKLRGDFVRLSVIDTGTGMPPEVVSRVFEPFFTTKDIGKGSGLGLAQVHGFATQSGGAVRIDTAPGRGTTIMLLLPRSAQAPMAAGQHLVEFHNEAPAAAMAGHVLLVEDDEEVAALVGQMLAELGFRATRVASAVAALGALADGRAIDLVFSDVMMPGGMNGVDLAREVKRRRPGLPVVLTTGYTEASKRDAAAAAGISVLPKPYRLEELAAVTRDALGR